VALTPFQAEDGSDEPVLRASITIHHAATTTPSTKASRPRIASESFDAASATAAQAPPAKARGTRPSPRWALLARGRSAPANHRRTEVPLWRVLAAAPELPTGRGGGPLRRWLPPLGRSPTGRWRWPPRGWDEDLAAAPARPRHQDHDPENHAHRQPDQAQPQERLGLDAALGIIWARVGGGTSRKEQEQGPEGRQPTHGQEDQGDVASAARSRRLGRKARDR
jgi:hypothetical protein